MFHRFSWSTRKMSAPVNFLEFEDPILVEYRKKVDYQISYHGVDRRLMLNYDQLWRIRYRGRGTRVHKPLASAGALADDAPRADKQRRVAEGVRSRIREADPSAVLPDLPKTRPGYKQRKRNEEVTNPAVADARLPHTIVTSMWANGDYGMLVMVFGDGKFPQSLMQQMNDRYRGRVVVFHSLVHTCVYTRLLS